MEQIINFKRMKALIISYSLMLLVSIGSAQLVQDEVVQGRFKTIQLDNGEAKYLKYDKKGETISIYNLDHSIWNTVKLPLPKGHLLYEIKLVSTNTFNKDDGVEILYSCVEYDMEYLNIEAPLNNHEYIHFTLNIIDDKGEPLLKVDNSNDFEIIKSGGKKKLLVYKHLSKGFNSASETLVYSIPQ